MSFFELRYGQHAETRWSAIVENLFGHLRERVIAARASAKPDDWAADRKHLDSWRKMKSFPNIDQRVERVEHLLGLAEDAARSAPQPGNEQDRVWRGMLEQSPAHAVEVPVTCGLQGRPGEVFSLWLAAFRPGRGACFRHPAEVLQVEDVPSWHQTQWRRLFDNAHQETWEIVRTLYPAAARDCDCVWRLNLRTDVEIASNDVGGRSAMGAAGLGMRAVALGLQVSIATAALVSLRIDDAAPLKFRCERVEQLDAKLRALAARRRPGGRWRFDTVLVSEDQRVDDDHGLRICRVVPDQKELLRCL